MKITTYPIVRQLHLLIPSISNHNYMPAYIFNPFSIHIHVITRYSCVDKYLVLMHTENDTILVHEEKCTGSKFDTRTYYRVLKVAKQLQVLFNYHIEQSLNWSGSQSPILTQPKL